MALSRLRPPLHAAAGPAAHPAAQPGALGGGSASLAWPVQPQHKYVQDSAVARPVQMVQSSESEPQTNCF